MSLKLLFLLIFLFLIKVNSFGIDNFCSYINNQDSICIKYQCGKNICSSDSNSCTYLKIWSNLMYKNTPFLNEKKVEEIFSFFLKLKNVKKKTTLNCQKLFVQTNLNVIEKMKVFSEKFSESNPKNVFVLVNLNMTVEMKCVQIIKKHVIFYLSIKI